MTYLEMVQALWEESGSGGPRPITIVDQEGEAQRLVTWIGRANLEIQRAHNDWDFLWSQSSFDTVPGTAIYPVPEDDIGVYDEDTFWATDVGDLRALRYLNAKGEPLWASAGSPEMVVIRPDRSLRIDPTPDDIYKINFDYHRTPVPLDATRNDAQSIIPEAYRYAIVGRALMFYAMYENAPEAMQQGQQMYGEWMAALQSHQLPGHRDMHRQAEGSYFHVEVE